MKISKFFYKIACIALLNIFAGQVMAQTPDPSVNGATVTPAPLPGVGANASVSFNFANSSPTAIPIDANNHINLSLSKLDVNGAFSVANNITTTGGNYFSFTYNTFSKTLTATQIAIIPAFSGESITFRNLVVTGTSFITSPQNGLNVNVVFLAVYNSNTNNDRTNSYTYTLIPAGGPLPIRLLSFNGIKDETKVQLKWQTSTEQNSTYFNVETSADGTTWTSIGKVNAAGTSTTQRDYALTHTTPVDGMNYYRLQQFDKDGNFVYSSVVAIKFIIKGLNIGAIYPNPFVDKLRIDVSSEKDETIHIQLSDNLGRVLRSFTVAVKKGANPVLLENLGSLAPGMYNVEVKTTYTTYRFKLRK